MNQQKVTEKSAQIADEILNRPKPNTAVVTQQIPNTTVKAHSEVLEIRYRRKKNCHNTGEGHLLPQRTFRPTSGNGPASSRCGGCHDDKAENMKTDTSSPELWGWPQSIIRRWNKSQVSYTADMPVAEIIKE